jgi:hypothetical protein
MKGPTHIQLAVPIAASVSRAGPAKPDYLAARYFEPAEAAEAAEAAESCGDSIQSTSAPSTARAAIEVLPAISIETSPSTT